MKKIIIAACMALLGCGSVFAQQGKQAIGGNLSYGTEIESVGIGLKYQYNITDQIRIEPSMNYFFKNDGLSMFDINANIHYLFPIASNISLYPLAGFTYTNWHLDLGKAGDYDVSVNKATAKLYPVANTPAAMLELGVEGVKTYIKTIGLYNSKAENIIKTCRILLEQHNGEVPEDRAALEALPGVGRKTANVVLNTAYGWPTIAVDTHIFRVCNRTQFAPGKNVEQVEEKLLKVVPAEFKVDCHHWLILHGRYTCIARKPRCGSCIIEDLCEYKEKVDI